MVTDKKKLILIILLVLIIVVVSAGIGYYFYKDNKNDKKDATQEKVLTIYGCGGADNALIYSEKKCSDKTTSTVNLKCADKSCEVINKSVFISVKDGNVYYIYSILDGSILYKGDIPLYSDDTAKDLSFGMIDNDLLIVYNDNKQYGIYDTKNSKFFVEPLYKKILGTVEGMWTLESFDGSSNKTYNANAKQFVG